MPLLKLFRPLRWLVLGVAGLATALAAEFRPTVGPGATKDDVINAYGWPTGQSQAGTKEILSYPQGKIILEKGLVERVDFSTTMPWPAPRPRPGTPPPAANARPEASLDFWLTQYDEAVREARRRNVRILALFTGSDWSPASRQFQDEVEGHPEFTNAVMADFVLLRLDFPTRTVQSPELRQQNAELRARYNVTIYPTLIVLSPAGAVVAHVDLARAREGESYRGQAIAAVREVKSLLAAQAPPPDPKAAAAPAEPEKAGPTGRIAALKSSLDSTMGVLAAALIGGGLIAFALWWLLWKARFGGNRTMTGSMTSRIGDAASGLPSEAELRVWPAAKLRTLVALLAETESYHVSARPGTEPSLALARGGETTPRILVSCSAGKTAPLSVKRLRELVGAMTVEDVPVGWFVSPAGFAVDARAYGEQNKILLIDAEALLGMLRDLPPLMLPQVLAKLASPDGGKSGAKRGG